MGNDHTTQTFCLQEHRYSDSDCDSSCDLIPGTTLFVNYRMKNASSLELANAAL